MALPWAVAIAIEWGALRWAFRRELEPRGRVPAERRARRFRAAPLAVLALTLAGFVVAGPLGLDAAWPAALGALRHGRWSRARRGARSTCRCWASCSGWA